MNMADSPGLILNPAVEKLSAAMKDLLVKHERTTHRLANLTDPSFQMILTEEEKKLGKKREVLLEEVLRDLQKYSGKYNDLAGLLRSKLAMLRIAATQGRQ